MQLTLAILGLLTALTGLAVYIWKRRRTPTPEERADDRAAEFRELEAQIVLLEARGDFAAADALRRRVLDRVAPQRDASGGDAAGQ